MPPESRSEALATDPLDALGPSLFLSILSHLPFQSLLSAELVSPLWRRAVRLHEKGVWRSACHRTGVEPKHMRTLESIERAAALMPYGGWSGDPDEPEPEPPSEGGVGVVNWREVCKAYVGMGRNWRWGRCREGWITPPGNTVWRIKVDPEEGTLISTSRTGGLSVVDAKSSQPLFALRGVRPWAHLEFCKGFAIFDVGQVDTDFSLQVYRTQPAISRSTHPTPRVRPPITRTAQSFTRPSWSPEQVDKPLPRGHLAYYRTITPPTSCIAFRARVDGADEYGDGGRAMLGTAGEEAVYLWDLEEEGKVEVIRFKEEDRQRIQYIEFDDDFVFLCGRSQMHIYSRQQRSKLVSFPPPLPAPSILPSHDEHEGPDPALASAAFTFDLENDVQLVPRSHVDDEIDPPTLYGPPRLDPALVARAESRPCWRGEDGFEEAFTAPVGRAGPSRRRPDGGAHLDFSACHYTDTDLVCSARLGVLIVVRNYKKVLSVQDESERQKALVRNTVWMDMQAPVKQVSTRGTHVVFNTDEHIGFFDTSTLPNLPDPTPNTSNPSDSPDPTSTDLDLDLDLDTDLSDHSVFRLHVLPAPHPFGVKESSCIQIDRDKIYMVYWALSDADGAGFRSVHGVPVGLPPERAMDGFGVCVRIWDFAYVNGN